MRNSFAVERRDRKLPCMQELIQNLISKVGLSEDQATGAIQQVSEFMKARLPDQFQGFVDQAIAGEQVDAGGLADQAKGLLGGMFGGDK